MHECICVRIHGSKILWKKATENDNLNNRI
jgi:hypothetical protein